MDKLTHDQLIERLRVFTQRTLEWCAKESEDSTAQVTGAIDVLLNNTARVSQISNESLAAIEGMQKAISIHFEGDQGRESLHALISSLQLLAREHAEVQGVIKPIIQALQFQDRLRQNLENMVRMLPIWLEFRKQLPTDVSPEQLRNFGLDLMKVTTMIPERDIIRKHLPKLEPEPGVPPFNLFLDTA